MKRYVMIAGAMALVVVGLWVVNVRVAKAPVDGGQATTTATATATTTTTGGSTDAGDEKACTMEAKLCPDGSYVGRTGPNCEFAACPATIAPYNSGVRGTVLLGPTCPVERIPPDPGCADRPYETDISVSRAGSNAVFATGKSDADGAFRFSLPPGDYTLTATGGSVLPRCSSVDVSVGPAGYAVVAISCDTGIRTPASSAATQPLQPAVTWSGTPIIIEFDESGAVPNVISVKRYEAATLILKAKATVPAEGINFLASQSSGGAPGPIKPGASETVVVRPARSFFYSPRSPDNLVRYPFYIYINVYY